MEGHFSAEDLISNVNSFNGNASMPFTDFHQVIVDGDIETIMSVLSQIEPSLCKDVLNTEVLYAEELVAENKWLMEQQPKLPLVLAATSGK